jgi:glycosyltransferase involved in cell wall biosynthesis
MKILMVLEGDFPPDLRVENEITSLIAAGHTVILGCFTFKSKDIITDWKGCKIYKKAISKFVHKSSVGALIFPIYFNFWRKFIDDIISNEKPDAIHIHDLPLARVGAEIGRAYHIMFTLDLHENWPALLSLSSHTKTFLGRILSLPKQWKRYEKESCTSADNVIVVIEEARQRLVKLGIPEDKITVVANYSNLSDFDNLPIVEKSGNFFTLFYAGGISKHRGLQFVIRALPEIKEKCKNIKVQILGDGKYKAKLEKIAQELKVIDNIEFTGKVPYKKVLEELGKADITLIPHIKSAHTDSTIPHKLFQYMYLGKSIIASNCDPLERIIISSNAGFIYQWDSPSDFAKAFTLAYNDKNYDATKVKQDVIEIYNWVSEERKLNEIYKI